MDENEKKRSKAEGWLMAVGVLLVVYVLSIGPAARWARKYSGFREAARPVYAPIKWLHDQTPLGKPIEYYCNWWSR